MLRSWYENCTKTIRRLYEDSTNTIRKPYENSTKTMRKRYRNHAKTVRQPNENDKKAKRKRCKKHTKTVRKQYEIDKQIMGNYTKMIVWCSSLCFADLVKEIGTSSGRLLRVFYRFHKCSLSAGSYSCSNSSYSYMLSTDVFVCLPYNALLCW